ncbi:hypothetical protein DF118_25605 [Burkholderia stagnalis]|nr:hypothetical protein WT14_11960 [Burkholderia stagnalis]RQQ23344.1 hypothetical protein DF163_27180 [Burkholderia stagnalis]RQQ24000.1 hypothetical protein DF149_29645 [Burkholderia stagnalis]RQX88856.1 hypothetical protein DF119_31030 [Burkholderia stagnalis]RQY07506.1 hypothetical protein DF118_25605 [Burkholderia stagnalis]
MQACRLATADWRRKGRAGRHPILASAACSLGWRLFGCGDWARAAARSGDRQVLAVRRAIHTALHLAGAVSVLEHRLSGIGIGMAAAGVAVLRRYDFVSQPRCSP